MASLFSIISILGALVAIYFAVPYFLSASRNKKFETLIDEIGADKPKKVEVPDNKKVEYVQENNELGVYMRLMRDERRHRERAKKEQEERDIEYKRKQSEYEKENPSNNKGHWYGNMSRG